MKPFAPKTYPFQTFQTQSRSGVFWDYGNWGAITHADMVPFPSDYDSDFNIPIFSNHAYSDLYVRPGAGSNLTLTYNTKNIDLSKFDVWRFTLNTVGSGVDFTARVGGSTRYSTSVTRTNEEVVIDLTADTATTYLRFTFDKGSGRTYSVKNVRLY